MTAPIPGVQNPPVGRAFGGLLPAATVSAPSQPHCPA